MQAENRRRMITFVIPFLNEEQNLPVLYERLNQVMANQSEDWEILFVDDGSTDNSARWVAEKAQSDSRVKLLRLSRNFGHQIAITAGMDHARGDATVIMDADLQDPPEVVPDMLRRWREGCDVVYAVRRRRHGEGLVKKTLAAAFYRVFRKLASVEVPVDAGDFRLLDRKVVEALRQVREQHRFLRGLTSWVGFRQCAVEYDRRPRYAGRTKYPVWKSLNLAWDAITSFSGVPLRWMTGFGVVVSLGGLGLAAKIVWNRIFHPETMQPGWASVMAVVLFLGGVQLISLGVLGQYLSRVFEETKKRPLYFIRETVGLD